MGWPTDRLTNFFMSVYGYGGIDVVISATTFDFVIAGTPVKIPGLGVTSSGALSRTC